MSSIKPINEKAKDLARTADGTEAEVRACAPLPKECTTLHNPGIETGHDNKTLKDLCNPYIRDIAICHMWPGQAPGTVYGMNTEKTLPQNISWHSFCSNWKDDWDKLPSVVTLQQPTDQTSPDALWDSAIKVTMPGQQGYEYLCDLHIRDNWQDTGVEPSPGVFWESPDIFFRNSLDDPSIFSGFNVDYHLDPIATKENWVYARVRNIGQQPISHAFVKFYISYPWSPNPNWQQIGHGVAHHILPGEVRIVRSMKPYIPVAATAHACLLAMIDSTQDFAKVVNWGAYNEADGPTPPTVNVQNDNNVAQRNIKVLSAAYGFSPIIEKFSLGIGRERLLRGVFGLEIDRGTLPRNIPIQIGLANVGQAALSRAWLGNGVQLQQYANVIHPWSLRNFEHTRSTEITYSGVIPRTGRRAIPEGLERPEGRPSRISETRLATLKPIRVSMPGISFVDAPVGAIRDLQLSFERDEPLMAELKIDLPRDGDVGEHWVRIRQFQRDELLGGITLLIRTDRPDTFMYFLDTTTGLIHHSDSSTLRGVRRQHLAPMHSADRALLSGARMAE